jgi:hypothetical protein
VKEGLAWLRQACPPVAPYLDAVRFCFVWGCLGFGGDEETLCSFDHNTHSNTHYTLPPPIARAQKIRDYLLFLDQAHGPDMSAVLVFVVLGVWTYSARFETARCRPSLLMAALSKAQAALAPKPKLQRALADLIALRPDLAIFVDFRVWKVLTEDFKESRAVAALAALADTDAYTLARMVAPRPYVYQRLVSAAGGS